MLFDALGNNKKWFDVLFRDAGTTPAIFLFYVPVGPRD